MLYAGIGNKIVHVNPARAITVMSVREDFVNQVTNIIYYASIPLPPQFVPNIQEVCLNWSSVTIVCSWLVSQKNVKYCQQSWSESNK